jgi:alpha-glucosidase (family GH31 glycosyl hydrolase)
MLPYWYAAFARYALDGLPIIRPLWFDHLSDSNTFHDSIATEEQIMVGDSILVRGVYEPDQTEVEIYLPNMDEQWFDFNDGEVKPINGGQRITRSVTLRSIPVFVKAGSIIPLKLTKRLSTDEMEDDPFSLKIYLKNDEAVGWLYVDDGDSMKYATDEDFTLIQLTYSKKELQCKHVRGNRDMPEITFDKIEIFNGLENDHPVEFQIKTHQVVRTIGCAGVCQADKDKTGLIYATQ